MYGAWWGALLSREVAECQRYTGASGRGITHRSSTLERAVSPSSVRGVKRASCSSTLRGRASVRVASCVSGVQICILYAHSHRKPESIYALAPPPLPPLPGGGRAGACRATRTVGGARPRASRDASRVHSSSVHSLHALPAASVPAIHKMLYSRCLKRFCSS